MNQTYREEVTERIKAIEVPEDLVNIQIGYIPLGKGIVIQKVQGGERKTKAGIILTDFNSMNAAMGRIVAMGPDCSDYLRKGLLVKYNPMTDIQTIIHGDEYILNTEHAIEGIVEDKELVIIPQNQSAESKRVNEKKEKYAKDIKTIRNEAENKKDAYFENLKDNKKTIKKTVNYK